MKSEFAIVNYIRFKERKGGPYLSYNFQNYYINEIRSYNGVDYQFAPFGFSGGGGRLGGERGRATLAMFSNAITQTAFYQADENRWLVEVASVEIDVETEVELALITREIWSCRLEGQIEPGKPQQTILQLSSPLSTVNAFVGGRPLSQALVGALPTSGSIST